MLLKRQLLSAAIIRLLMLERAPVQISHRVLAKSFTKVQLGHDQEIVGFGRGGGGGGGGGK